MIVFLLGILVFGSRTRADVELPPVHEILNRMVERAALWVQQDAHYTYWKRSVQEQLDGRVKSVASGDSLFQILSVRAERWLSGLKRTPGKREWAYTPPGVRISLSPPVLSIMEVALKLVSPCPNKHPGAVSDKAAPRAGAPGLPASGRRQRFV